MAFSSKPCRRSVRLESPEVGFTPIAGGCLVILAFMFVLYVNLPSLSVRLKVAIPGAENATPNQTMPGQKRKPTCNFSHARAAYVCEMEGDVRIHGKSSTVDCHLTTTNISGRSWRVKPYTRKYSRAWGMRRVREIQLREVKEHHLDCQVNHTVPAVVFSMGGYLGNVFHDFSDVILPLFITTRHLSGNVQFLVSDYNSSWSNRYKAILKGLSKHAIIDLGSDERVHCFPGATVGLTCHEEFSISPSLSRHGLSTANFVAFVHSAFSLNRSVVTSPSPTGARPRLLLITRKRTRKLTGIPKIVAAAKQVGFDVVVEEATEAGEFARIVNSCDVMVGVHGAGLTNMVSLPEGAVVVQILPLGERMEWLGNLCYGNPAREMGLRYLEYKITEEESTLLDAYPRNHSVFADPYAYVESGWEAFREIYLRKQDVKLNVERFSGVLKEALELLRQPHRGTSELQDKRETFSPPGNSSPTTQGSRDIPMQGLL